MRPQLMILAFTALAAADMYHDRYYTRLLQSWKKYYQIAGVVVAGIGMYIASTRRPEMVRGAALDAARLFNDVPLAKEFSGAGRAPPASRVAASGRSSAGKRSVSETKKKYVAASQNWRCKHCDQTLSAWFEVDHVVRLDDGGSNHVENLVALCRECHGAKTAAELMAR